MIYYYPVSASPQTLNPVGVNVSPYRVVRVVDKEGHITGIRESSDTTLECTRQVNLNKNKNLCDITDNCQFSIDLKETPL